MTPSEVQQVVDAYAAVLAEDGGSDLTKDVSSLPYSKPQIKSALLIALASEGDPTANGQLRNGFMALADFQDLSDEQIAALQRYDKLLQRDEFDLTTAQLHAAAVEIGQLSEVVRPIQARCAAEAEKLAAELRSAGF